MKIKSDLVFSIVILLTGILVFIKSKGFPDLPEGHPGPGLFPVYIGSGLILCGIFLLINAFRFQKATSSDFSGKWLQVLLILILLFIFPFAYQILGFFIVIAIVVFLIGLLLHLRLISAVLTAVLTTGFIYLIFNQILHVLL